MSPLLMRRSVPELPPGGEIRRAERRDIPRLVDLWLALMQSHGAQDPRFQVTADARQVMTRRYQYLLQERDALLLLSQANGETVGFAAGHIDTNLPFLPGDRIAFISDLYVEPSHRRQGRARRLVDALWEWFRSRNVSSVQLHAAATNPDAHEFWVRMGFQDYLIRMWAKI